MEVRQNIVVFTGAGISKESGIPTFRDMDGMWKKYDAMKLASAAGFDEDPEAVLEFYNARRRNLLEVQPNHAHHEVPKFLIDPSDMVGRLPLGFKHIKASAVQGVDILLEELGKL